MKKTLYLVTVFFLCAIKINGQNSNIPNNAKEGKCYVRCFNYETIVDWEETDCSKKEIVKTKETIQESKAKTEKLKAYQKKLIELGYKLQIIGIADDKTIIAHNNYILKKQKAERKRLRIKKKNNKKVQKNK